MGLSIIFWWIQCTPIERLWNHSIPGTCWPRGVKVGYDIFSGAYSGSMDITLAMLPWRIVWNLQMKKREKFGVAVAMSMGVLYAFPFCMTSITANQGAVLEPPRSSNALN